MRAQGGGTLTLDGSSAGVFNNNATIRSENGSNVTILFSKLVGGTLDNTGSTGTLTLNDGTIRDVTIAAGSTVTTGGNNAGYLENTLINHGTLSPATNSSILLASDTTLSGGGVVALGSINSALYNLGSNRTLTNTDNVLRGSGQIGYSSLSVINGAAGTIQADVSGQTLHLNGSGSFTNNGLMLASNGATLYFSGTGTATNSGGTLHVLPTSTIKGDGGIIQTAGTIDLDGGSMNFPLGVDLNGGQLIGNGTFTGPIRNNAGIVGPGHSAGEITVTGTYTQGADSALDIEIGGTTAGTDFDQLQVNGMATLGGTLALSFINGFQNTIQNTDTFVILTSGQNLAGAFANVASGARLVTADGFGSFRVDYDGTAVTLSNFQPALQLQLITAVSRKTHGASGDFDLPLVLSPAGNGTVEPRANGPTIVVFAFSRDIAAADGMISSNEFTIVNATYSSAVISGNTLALNLTGVIDQTVVSVTLNGINDTGGNALTGDNDVEIRALVADASQDRTVKANDYRAVKAHKGETLDQMSGNFLFDLDLDGVIAKRDGKLVRMNKNHTVP